MNREVEQVVSGAFRESWGQIVATLIGMTGDWDLAEECAQDAFVAASEAWPRRGVPDMPGAWLTSVARAIAPPTCFDGELRAQRS